jgi:hypothetical protein
MDIDRSISVPADTAESCQWVTYGGRTDRAAVLDRDYVGVGLTSFEGMAGQAPHLLSVWKGLVSSDQVTSGSNS